MNIDYSAYDYKRFSAVLHGTYHSGTACAEPYNESSVLYLMDLSTKENPDIDIYLSPSKNEGERYDTVRVIGSYDANDKKINFLYGSTIEYAYAKLVLAYSLFKDKKDIEAFIK